MPETSFNNRLAQRPRGKEASFEVDIESEVTYYAVDKMLSEKIQAIAQKLRGPAPLYIQFCYFSAERLKTSDISFLL